MTRLYLWIAFLFAGIVPALSQASFTTVTIDKKIQPGLVLHLPNNTDVAEGTILQTRKKTVFRPEPKANV